MFWRPNIGGMSPGLGPYQFSKGISRTISWLFAKGMVATDIDSLEGHWAQSGFSYWALAAAHWHPGQFDRDAALQEFCIKGFGERAAARCAAYINFWEDWTNTTFLDPDVVAMKHTSWVPRGSGSMTSTFVYTNETLAKGESLMQALVKSCQQPDGARAQQQQPRKRLNGCAQRAQFWADGLKHARLTLAAIRAVNRSRVLGDGCTKQRTCDIGGPFSFLEEALALIQFRRTIAAGSAVNVLSLSAEEVNGDVINGTHYTDMTGIQTAAAVITVEGFTTPEMSLSPVWGLAWDTDNTGVTDSPPWFSVKENRKNQSKWQPTVVTCGWNQTTTGAAWRDHHGGKDYTGVAWYRSIFFMPPRLQSNRSQARLALAVVICGTSVDGWLNGVKMTVIKTTLLPSISQYFCKKVLWKLSPITHRVVRGRLYENQIAVRVDGGGGGGVGEWRSSGAPPTAHVLSAGLNSLAYVLNP